MATRYFLGNAPEVAQVSTVTPANVEIGDIFRILIGGQIVVSFTATVATVANVTAGLHAAWVASIHGYKQFIASTDSTTHVTLTSTVAGMPFIVTTTTTDGGGANTQTLTVATTVANSGPNDISVALNWSGSTVPVSGDTIIIANTNVNIMWGGSAFSAVNLDTLRIEQSFTGKIGLDYTKFSISADGDTVNESLPEYRTIGLVFFSVTLYNHGRVFGPIIPAGSSRCIIDIGSNSSGTVEVFATAASSADAGLPALRLKANHSSTNIFVRSGSVGIAANIPGETSTINKLSMSGNCTVTTGLGTTISIIENFGGNNLIQSSATIGDVNCTEGTLTFEGDFTIGAMSVSGGTCNSNNIKTGSVAITQAEVSRSGVLNGLNSTRSRTWSAVYLLPGGTLKYNGKNVTITTFGTGGSCSANYAGKISLTASVV